MGQVKSPSSAGEKGLGFVSYCAAAGVAFGFR